MVLCDGWAERAEQLADFGLTVIRGMLPREGERKVPPLRYAAVGMTELFKRRFE